MSSEPTTRISVSEDRLRALFAEFKLDLLEELKSYVRIAAFEALVSEVRTLQLWQAGVMGGVSAKRQVAASTIAWATLAVAALTALGTVVWLTH